MRFFARSSAQTGRQLVGLVLYLSALLFVGGIVINAARHWLDLSPAVTAGTPPVVAENGWISVTNPHPAFAIDGPEVAGLAQSYEIRRQPHTGERLDILRLGEFDKDQPVMAIAVWRRGTHTNPINHNNAIDHAIDAIEDSPQVASATIPLSTKFGALPVRHSYIAPASGQPRRCLTFNWQAADKGTHMHGWWCSANTAKVERARLACALDRIALLSAGGSAEFARTFADIELHRLFCTSNQSIARASLPPPDWMDGDPGFQLADTPEPERQAQAPLRASID